MKIKHVYGNVLRIDIPLTVKIVTSDGGHTQETKEPFYPDTSKPILVELANKYNTKYTYEATMTENVAHIEDYGDARVGVYKVTVRCYDEQGQPYRYMARDIIDIVDATADAGIEAGIEFDSETYTLEGAYFIKGEKGDTGEGVPSGGTTGQVLKKKSNNDYDTEWSSDNAPVTSVNGKTGEVTLDAEDVGALPADTPIPAEQIQSDWNQSDNTKKDFIKNKPSIPSALADLSDDTTHRVVTDSEKSTWNGKQDAINDLSEIRSGAAAGATAVQTETDPTVPSWAKQSSKPSYTAQEVGALPADTALFDGDYNSLTNKPTIPSVPTNVSAFNNDAGYLTQHQDISGKEDMTTIVAPVNTTDATLPITTLTTEIGKYYRIDVPIETLAVTLPAMGVVTSIKTVVIYLTGGTTPAVTITSADSKDVYYQDGYEIGAGKTYEVNALFNGSAWIIASVEIVVPSE